jgi:hypothetical protein
MPPTLSAVGENRKRLLLLAAHDLFDQEAPTLDKI